MRVSDSTSEFTETRVSLRLGKRLWFPRDLVCCLFLAAHVCQLGTAQATPAWTWVGGSDKVYQPGTYGTLGTPSPGNIPPGRWSAESWTDKSGNLWLFGGRGYDANTNATGVLLDDLWEFNPALNEWTWMGGSSTFSSNDGGWSGVYGTIGLAAHENIPGSRADAIGWTDTDGNFWLFGGNGYDASGITGTLNDLWEYSRITHEWAWISGSNAVPKGGGLPGAYGALGTPAQGNTPGSRMGAISWTDQSGNLWLFGGGGFDQNANPTALNDLWRFEPSTKMWTWMGGSASSNGCVTYKLGAVICVGQPGVYGIFGTPAAGNIPGGRSTPGSWTDGSGGIWLFAGQGVDAVGDEGNLNDLWKFDSGSLEWAWLGGNTTEGGCGILTEGNTFCMGQPGVYGSLGVPGPGNDPGGRFGPSTWTDKNGNLWLFAGYGADSAGDVMGVLSDLWEYLQSTTALPAAATPVFSPVAGDYLSGQTITISGATSGSAIYYTTNGSAPTTKSAIYSGSITFSPPSETIDAIAIASGYSPSAMASATYNLPPDFNVSSSSGSLTIVGGQTGSVGITVFPLYGFNSTVSFSCSGLPDGVSCSFSPASVTAFLNPTGTTLTLSTSAVKGANRRSRPLGPGPLFPAAAGATVFCCIPWKRRRLMRWMLAAFVAGGFGLSFLSGCGGGSTQSHPTTATITVKASSATVQHSTSFSLTVE